jgi:peptidoglycan/LPS O-acetylase OafA/YrhL
VYLIHVPLQMIFLLIMRATKTEVPTGNPWLMVGFAAILVTAATATHYGFERPVRRWLRNRGEAVAVAPSSAAAA